MTLTVLIQIHYLSSSGNKIMQQVCFPLRNRSEEIVAFEFWQWIRQEYPIEVYLEQVLVVGKDITDLVIELEKASHKLRS